MLVKILFKTLKLPIYQIKSALLQTENINTINHL